MQNFTSNGVTFAYKAYGKAFDAKSPVIIWAHGWGQNHSCFAKLIEPLESVAHHISLDLPGFGQSAPPPENWGTQDYADAIAAWLKQNNFPAVIWVGHSFGCRVGVQIASNHPEMIKALGLISGAGLKRKRPAHKKIYFYCRIKLFKFLKKFVPDGTFKDSIMTKFGSADYNNAGTMRKIFVRVVNEDLSVTAQAITCPTALIYGENDTETPPEFGTKYSQLIKSSKLFLLNGQDHYSVLGDGRHQVIKILSDFIKENT